MPDVIIIGGGLAGLATATTLASKGKDVVLLEKYPNLGGRAITFKEGTIQYEIGAGRVFKDHHRVNTLVKKYKLDTFPIHSEYTFEHGPNEFNTLFSPLAAVLDTLPTKTLQTHTVQELLPKSFQPILDMYPYRAEMELLRADLALPLFKPNATMGPNAEFYGLKAGYSALVDHMADDAKAAGATIKTRYRVKSTVKQDGVFVVSGHHGKKATEAPFRLTAPVLIIATCRCSLSGFEVLKNAPLLKQLATSALCRIYAVFPPAKDGKVWFDDVKHLVTTNPLRFVIPINNKTGLIMISYTDGRDTDYWSKLEDKELEDEIVRNARMLWPSKTIPKPTFLKKHMWPSGCTYWLPGDYDVLEASQAAHNPAPNLYVVGESINPSQCWLESALESAETVAKLLA